MPCGGHGAQHVNNLLGDSPPGGEISAEGAQLIGWRNTVMPDQEGYLLERQGLRNIMDIVAAKGKLGDRPVDVGNARLAGQYTFEPGNHLLGCLAHDDPRSLRRWLVCALCCAVKAILAAFCHGVKGKGQRSATGLIEKDVHIASVSGVRPAMW